MKSSSHFAWISLIVLAGSGPVLAQSPQMGGEMKHIMVQLHGNALHGHVDPLVPTPVMRSYGETYTGNAAVLDGTLYNAQYGWMVEGFWAPPAESYLWIERVSATPGLLAYSGGTMMHQGTFTPIFGTDGSSSSIQWDGTMLHNWYAVTSPGAYSATYRIFFGGADGSEIPGYVGDEVTLHWTAIPAPGAVSLLAVGGLLAVRRRRS